MLLAGGAPGGKWSRFTQRQWSGGLRVTFGHFACCGWGG